MSLQSRQPDMWTKDTHTHTHTHTHTYTHSSATTFSDSAAMREKRRKLRRHRPANSSTYRAWGREGEGGEREGRGRGEGGERGRKGGRRMLWCVVSVLITWVQAVFLTL